MRRKRFQIKDSKLFDNKFQAFVGDFIEKDIIELKLDFSDFYDEKLLYRIIRETGIKDIWYNRNSL